MEQITREEMVDLLDDLRPYVQLLSMDSGQLDRIEKAKAALQAAEPVGFGLKGMLTGKWNGRTFVEREDAESFDEAALLPLFAIPCPPAKAQVPELLKESGPYTYDAHERGFVQGWNSCRKAMLTASPAPNNDKDGCTCQGCGIVYAADLIVPDEWWEKIKPEGKEPGSGLLCPTCIMDRLVQEGWSAGHIASPAPDRSEQSPELYLALRNLRQSVEFLEQCKRENPDAATGAWKDAWDWVESTAVSVVNIIRQQEEAER